ncbi:MAG: phage portal protein, partial [Clostridia bacterium]|nr:phage portal protein [Clostridia bacterium]
IAISEELGRLSVLELESDADEDLNTCYQQFLSGAFRHVTSGLYHGHVIFKPYIRGDKVHVSVVTPDNFKILLWDEQQKIPVVTEFYEHRGEFVRVETHEITNGGYIVRNRVFKKGKEQTVFPDVFAGYAREVALSCVHKPLFGLFSTADGKPVFERAIPLIAEAERQFERLLWEFESGERALYVADTAFLRDFKGKPKVPDKKLYRLLSANDELFRDWTPNLRDESILNGLDAIIKRIEDSCSVSRATFSDVSTSPRTATELKMAKHRTYAAVCEIQKAFCAAVEDMLYGVAVLKCLYGDRKSTEVKVNFKFGDSVLDAA